MFVIPAKGLAIIDPVRRDVLPPEGRNVNDDHPYYWDRHRQDGAVTVIVDPGKIKEAEAALEKADTVRAAQIKVEQAKASTDAEDAKPEAPKPVQK